MGWRDDPVVSEQPSAQPAWASDPVDTGPDGRAMLGHAIMDAAPAFGRGAMKTLTLGHRLDALGAGAFVPGETYGKVRQEQGQKDVQAQQEHPIAFGAGQIAPSLAVPAAAFSSLPAALATGAGIGAASAIADTPEDDPALLARRALKGGLTGAATSAIGVGAPKAAGPVSEGLENVARSQAKRVLSGGGTPMNAGKKALSNEAADAALEHGIVPFGTTQGTADRLQNAREVLGDQYGRIVQALEDRGITGADQEALIQQFAAEAHAANANTMNPAVPKIYEQAGAQIAGKPAPNGKLGLTQNENLKRSAQGMAKSAYAKLEPGEVGNAHEDVASILRQSAEDAIDSQMPGASPDTQAIGAQFKPIKEELGPVIEASRSANGAAARSSRARAMSPSDMIMAAGGIAKDGLTGGATMGLLNHFARTRGASTVAWGAHAASDKIAALARVNPASLGKYGAVLGAALAKGDSEYNANYYVLGSTDPEFRALAERLTNEP